MGLFFKLYPHFAPKWDPICLNPYCISVFFYPQIFVDFHKSLRFFDVVHKSIRTIRVKKAPLFKKAPPLLRSKKIWIWGARRRRKKFGVEIIQNVQKTCFGGSEKTKIFRFLEFLRKPPPLLGTKNFKGGLS